MKIKISFPCALIILVVALAGSSIGAKAPDCAAGNVHFACPKNFKVVPLESTQGFSLFYWKKYDVGVFVAAPASDFDERIFMTKLTKTSLAKMFPKESQSFSWKPVDYSGRISKFEIGAWVKDMAMGFKHLFKWDKVAIVTDQKGVEKFTDVFSYAVPGEYKGFSIAELDAAKAWVSAPEVV